MLPVEFEDLPVKNLISIDLASRGNLVAAFFTGFLKKMNDFLVIY